MTKENSLSDEVINSLVDHEFPARDRARILSELHSNVQDKERVCQMNNLKDLVKTAYQDIPDSRNKETFSSTNRSWMTIAASLVLVLIIGLFYQGFISKNHQRMVLLDPNGKGQLVSSNKADELRIVFHVSNSTKKNADELLDDIEGLLQHAKNDGRSISVEVVAHAEGLDLLREKLSTQKRRITRMSHDFPDLTFVACLNTIKRLKVEKGIVVSLIPEASTTNSGVAYLVKRQQEGWIYIQI